MNPLKSKRGVAIELAILTMMVTFGFCLILTTICLSAKAQDTEAQEDFAERYVLDEIGEDFIYAVRVADGGRPDFTCQNSNYTVNVFSDETDSTLMVWKNWRLVMEVKVEKGTCKVKKWSYAD